MKFIFWQNTNSIHQSAFLSSLASSFDCDVTLVTTESLSSERKEMGWSEPSLKNVTIFKLQDNGFNWKQFFDNNIGLNCIHVFSGIGAFPKIHSIFKYAVSKECKIGILTEALDDRYLLGKMRLFRGKLFQILYGKKISFVLAIGEKAISQFKFWGYSENIIFSWAYTIENNTHKKLIKRKEDDVLKIIFVGSLILRKGYDILITAMSKGVPKDFILDMFCLSKTTDLNKYSFFKTNILPENISLKVFLSNDEIKSKISEYDLLVLPSRFDGWGAVVSESLSVGTPVLVSNRCGSSTLLSKNSFLGNVLLKNDKTEIREIINKIIVGKEYQCQEVRERIISWSENNISGLAMANYFLKMVFYLNNPYTEKPKAGWSNPNY